MLDYSLPGQLSNIFLYEEIVNVKKSRDELTSVNQVLILFNIIFQTVRYKIST